MLVNQILKVILLVFSMFITETVTNVLRPSESNAGGRTLFGGYRITPKHCKAARKLPMNDERANGPTICMFNHECTQRQGEVVGACMDGFLFGACCQISSLDDIGNSLLYNAQTAVTNKQQQVTQHNKVDVANQPLKESQLNNYLYKPLNDYQTQAAHDSTTKTSQNTLFNALQNTYSQDFDRLTFSTDLPVRLTSASKEDFSEGSYEYENGNQLPQVPLQPIASLQDQLLNPIKPDNYYPTNDISSDLAQVTLNEYASSKNSTSAFKTSTPSYQQVDTSKAPSENKYVLVQTITNDNLYQKIDNNSQLANNVQSTSEMSSPVEYTTLKLNDYTNYKISEPTEKNQLYYDTATPSEQSMMGEAYPVDISLLEDHNDMSHGQTSESSTTRPHTPYDSLIMAQNFNIFKTSQKLDKVPEEVTVSSQTTHVKGDKYVDKTRPLVQVFSTTQGPASTTKLYDNTKYEYLISSSTLKAKPLKTSETKTSTPSTTTQRIPGSLYQHILNENDNYIPIELSTDIYDYNKHSVSASTTKKPVAISYVTGPTSPRPSLTSVYDANSKVPPIFNTDNLEESQHLPNVPTYQPPIFAASATPITIQGSPSPIYNMHQAPTFFKIQSTMQPGASTVLITPKPTVSVSSTTVKVPVQNKVQQSTTKYPDIIQSSTIASLSSISQIYNQLLTMQPGNSKLNLTNSATKTDSIEDNDTIILHPAFAQSTTEAVFSVPTDDKPAFPGYFGPTPTYPQFVVPTSEKLASSVEEEMNTSPNDYVNFPPVRNPNLNMSASSSAVTTDLELSTPTFVEDMNLKNKMNTLVNKIVESLQGNFDALSDMIDESNKVTPTLKKNSTTLSTRTTRKPTTTKPKVTTKKPQTQVTKQPSRKTTTSATRKTTKSSATRKPTRSTTKKPITQKPTEDLVDEQDESDVNPVVNQVNDETGTPNARNIQCGMRPMVKSGRIVGGKGSTFGEFPWQVLVRESTWLGLFTKNKCGGVLITNRFVLTAAHCQPGFLASLVAVLGEYDISSNLENKKPVTKNVKRVIVHRQYNAATFENDLALLELESPVQFDVHIVPICMPPDQADFTGRMATVTGWGRLSYDGVVPSILQEVQVPIIENNVCQEMFHTAGHNKKILNSFLCAGYANGQKDSCEGDSGGPLVLQRADGRYELAGTVSHGIKCAAPYLPGVYIRTTYYKPWLRSITGVK